MKIFHILFLFFALLSFGASEVSTSPNQENQSRAQSQSLPNERIVYAKNATPDEILEKPIYVGQTIPITYSALLMNNAILQQSLFTEKLSSDKLTLKTPNAQWKGAEDNSVQITYYFKIKSPNAMIPEFEVIAKSKDNSYTDSSIVPSIHLNVIDLYQNKKYVGVVADSLKVGIYKAKNYDADYNLLAFELIATNANLEDFKIPDFQKQGIERSNFSAQESSGIFYCVVPRNIQNIIFEYFSLPNNRFETIQIPVIPAADIVSTQESLKPKNTYLLYYSLFIGAIIVTLLILSFFFKKIRKILWILSFGVFVYLLFYLFYTKSGTLESGKHIWVLPTHNSTILETTKTSMKVKVIGEHDKYYKIITPDDKVGWIRKEDAE